MIIAKNMKDLFSPGMNIIRMDYYNYAHIHSAEESMHTPSMQAVRAFVCVASTGSFSKAALELHMTASSVSRLIKALETQLGVVLILRTTRAMSLTEAGQHFFTDCQSGFEQFRRAFERVGECNAQPAGILKVSVPVSFARSHVIPHLAAFLQAHPRVQLDLSVTDRYVDVVAEAMSAAIRIGRIDDSNLIVRRLMPTRRVVLAAPDYLARHGEPATPDDLKHHQCLILSTNRDGESWRLTNEHGQRSIRPQGRVRADNGEAIRQLAIDGAGIAFLSQVLVERALHSGKLVRILNEWAGQDTGVYCVFPGRPPTSAAAAFFTFLKQRWNRQSSAQV